MRTLILLLAACITQAADAPYDVVVYGGTSAGVIAAVQSARMGKRTVLIEPTRHLGGMTSGGLGATDLGKRETISGLTREFYQRILKHYQDPARADPAVLKEYATTRHGRRYLDGDVLYAFEPHVAQRVYNEMAKDAGVTLVFGERLNLTRGVTMAGPRIGAITMESGRVFAGGMFIDATYEGDVMAKAGVSYIVGREASAQYDEKSDGVHVYTGRQSLKPLDPWVKPGDPSSGLLPGLHSPLPRNGVADSGVQAYNYRLCLTTADNRIPFTKPVGFDPLQYELLLRLLDTGVEMQPLSPVPMPNNTTDTNNHWTFSTDWIGMSWAYPEAGYAVREKIAAGHRAYIEGLLWTMANDPRIPAAIRAETARWGHAAGEFTDNDHWPYQLYVREARRMVGGFVMTEHEVLGRRDAPDPVALGSYFMDCHGVRRYIDGEGYLRLDGGLSSPKGFPPYGISYRSLTPKAGECENLLVPICLSATHSAYGSIRMEPVYMMLAQASGTAAAMALDAGSSVQRLSYDKLRARLLADGLVIEWPPSSFKGLRSRTLPGLVMDDAAAGRAGGWTLVMKGVGVDGGYYHDGNTAKGKLSAVYKFTIPTDGRYEVRLAYVAHPNRATNVPVTIDAADGKHAVTVSERAKPPIDGAFVSLGVHRFAPGKPATVTIRNTGTDGYVVLDAVQLLPVP